MKTLTLKTHLTKAALLGALTIVPALALTSSAQAAPTWNRNAPTRSNSYTTPRYDQRDNGRSGNRANQGQRYDNDRNNAEAYRTAPRYDADNNGRYQDYRNNGRGQSYNYGNNPSGNYGYGYNNNSYGNYNRDRNNGNNTGNTVVAGILGAILGSVLSR